MKILDSIKKEGFEISFIKYNGCNWASIIMEEEQYNKLAKKYKGDYAMQYICANKECRILIPSKYEI